MFLEDVRAMFLDMTLPLGWETWKKRRVDWTVHTTGLLLSAARNTTPKSAALRRDGHSQRSL